MNIQDKIHQFYPKVVEWRRYFHQHPELSYEERHTSERIAEFLNSLDLQEVRTNIGGYGVTGLLVGEQPGPTIALRADMDALPIQDEKQCEYRSQVPNVMHACGHDGHMATLMGTAAILSQMKKQIKGKILFLFQPAEEVPPGGAKKMVEAGVLNGVDAIYGIHLWTPLPIGTMGIAKELVMGSADQFQIEIHGKGGHGGLPHQAVDSVVVASQIVCQLQTIVSRQIDPLESGVITVGQIQGGTAFNVVAEQARLVGTTRSFDPQVREDLLERIEQVVKSVCQAYGADYQYNVLYGYPAVINDPKKSERVRQIAQRHLKDIEVLSMKPMMTGEDFAYYLQEKPGAFCYVGAGNAERGMDYPHHHPRFDFDESAMKTAMELFIQIALHNGHTDDSIHKENVSLSDWLS